MSSAATWRGLPPRPEQGSAALAALAKYFPDDRSRRAGERLPVAAESVAEKSGSPAPSVADGAQQARAGFCQYGGPGKLYRSVVRRHAATRRLHRWPLPIAGRSHGQRHQTTIRRSRAGRPWNAVGPLSPPLLAAALSRAGFAGWKCTANRVFWARIHALSRRERRRACRRIPLRASRGAALAGLDRGRLSALPLPWLEI